jgi:Rad3-related DNA helicase
MNEKILLGPTRELPWELLKNEKLVIAYATPRKRDEIIAAAGEAGISIFHLKEPQFYLSPQKLSAKLAEKKVAEEETPFLLKMILWNAETKTGDREEISLEREEYGLFDLLADHEGQDVFWRKAKEEAQACNIVLIHQYALGRTWDRGSGSPQAMDEGSMGSRSLVVLEAERLEDSFTNALKEKYTEARLRPIFGEKATLLFGLLGIFHERFSELDAGGFRGNVILHESVRQSKEWKQFWGALINLSQHYKKVAQPRLGVNEVASLRLGLLKDFSPAENMIQWVSSYANEIAFSSAPLSLAATFYANTKDFSKIILQSEVWDGGEGLALTRELFELDSSWKEEKSTGNREQGTGNEKFEIKIPEDFPEPYSGGYFKRCEKLFLELIQRHKGKCLFLMSSKKAATAIYQALLPKMPSETRLLATGPTGGIGKSTALFLENPTNSVLIVTNQILPHLGEIEDHIEVVVFQKIPFDPPDDPILSARSKQFENGFEEYTLPRAIMRFRGILAELRASSKNTPKTCYLLDSRLKTRDYGNLFWSKS